MSKERNEEEQILEVDDSSSDEDFEHITMFSSTAHVSGSEEEPQPFKLYHWYIVYLC